jgi:uncharacterized membrane protein YebE (DUF533 family)
MIGAFLQNASAPSGQDRMGSALENLQREGLGGSGGGGGLLDGILGAVKGGLGSAVQNPAAAGGIGAMLGSLIGGGGDSVKGAVGGGALAMLAGVAMKALANSGQSPGGAAGFSGGTLPLGLKAPEGAGEEQALENTAELMVKAMINAAKSDGEIGPKEMERIVGKLRESGMDQEAQQWVMAEMRKPLDLDGFIAEVSSPEVAAEVYAASLLAIEVDTDAEREYLQRLAQGTGLEPAVVQYINSTMGVA